MTIYIPQPKPDDKPEDDDLPFELVDEDEDDTAEIVTLPIRPVDFPKWYASKQIGAGE